ncbi:MAG: hypothetical protein GF331_05380 [Chitinivibrionales bacterium]|nr:hypothetical protein [Chitinivibrionales bacterium]
MLVVVSAQGVRAGRDSPHELLKRIRSPLDMARPCMPRRYTVPVDVHGSMAEQIRTTLAERGLEKPRFEEWMELGSFSLVLANKAYTIDTRELVSGILNPPEMIDLVVRSVIRYHDPDTFRQITEETHAAVKPVPDRPGWVSVELTPKGKRFAYRYQDLGTDVDESWLEGLTVVMDTVRNLIHELVQQRRIRRYSIQQTTEPSVQNLRIRYSFSYDSSTGHVLPERLEVFTRDRSSMVIEAKYRTEGKHVVFDERGVCHGRGDQRSCLYMRYGAYRFEKPGPLPTETKPTDAVQEIERAAELSREATEQLRAGDIRASLRTLQRLVEEHPRTPQALEARRLLEDLPYGF